MRLAARQHLACVHPWPDESAWMFGLGRKSRGVAKEVPLTWTDMYYESDSLCTAVSGLHSIIFNSCSTFPVIIE